ncbi:MAG TPA: SUF system Fe-S cluster assembly regulator, partial [Thermoanaerobaculia bacterium]|nr:SUF system Fe-S cluster assembly regulator [Thermoanaerobaculia bacterium]
MIRLTKQTDYGIVLMSQIAASHGAQFTAPELAQETHLPLPMVSKILKALTRAGLLVSQRGAKGGYALAYAPAEISVATIIAALEGPIAITECVEESEEACSYEATCRVRSNWQRINQAVSGALAGISLEEMAEPWKTRSQVPVALRPPAPRPPAPRP